MIFMSEKILVLVEGVEKETTFFETFNRNYIGLNDDIRLVPFGCNIYSLFQEMKGYDFEIDLEKAIEFPLSIPKEQKAKIKGMRFGTKYLVFDFDFQEKTMSDEDKIIAVRQMLDIFNNDTENGLLFINYPMFESFQEKIASETMYTQSKINRLEFANYKRSISERNLGINCKNIPFSEYKTYILTALKESNFLFHGNFDKKLPYEELVSEKYGMNVYQRQIKELQMENSIFPINTSVLLPLLYFGYSKYKTIS